MDINQRFDSKSFKKAKLGQCLYLAVHRWSTFVMSGADAYRRECNMFLRFLESESRQVVIYEWSKFACTNQTGQLPSPELIALRFRTSKQEFSRFSKIAQLEPCTYAAIYHYETFTQPKRNSARTVLFKNIFLQNICHNLRSGRVPKNAVTALNLIYQNDNVY